MLAIIDDAHKVGTDELVDFAVLGCVKALGSCSLDYGGLDGLGLGY
jgi:hypothetical protein